MAAEPLLAWCGPNQAQTHCSSATAITMSAVAFWLGEILNGFSGGRCDRRICGQANAVECFRDQVPQYHVQRVTWHYGPRRTDGSRISPGTFPSLTIAMRLAKPYRGAPFDWRLDRGMCDARTGDHASTLTRRHWRARSRCKSHVAVPRRVIYRRAADPPDHPLPSTRARIFRITPGLNRAAIPSLLVGAFRTSFPL